jgi:hypothetical protein
MEQEERTGDPKMTLSTSEGSEAKVHRVNQMATNFNNPKAISEAGETIYDRLYKTEYEKFHKGKFVAINILDESATVGDTATEALASAKEKYPKGLFHLIRIGHRGAFEVGLAFRHVPTGGVRR